jgi:hypothetical protein
MLTDMFVGHENCRTKTSFIYTVENIETSYIVFFSAGLVKRHLSGIVYGYRPWVRGFRITSYNGQIMGLLSDWYIAYFMGKEVNFQSKDYI